MYKNADSWYFPRGVYGPEFTNICIAWLAGQLSGWAAWLPGWATQPANQPAQPASVSAQPARQAGGHLDCAWFGGAYAVLSLVPLVGET